jgi:hypothetical protein
MLLLNALNGTSALMALFMLKLIVHRLNKKVNLCMDRPKGVQEVEAPRISRQSAHEGGKIASPTLRPPLPPSEDPWYSFLVEAESSRRLGHCEARRIK